MCKCTSYVYALHQFFFSLLLPGILIYIYGRIYNSNWFMNARRIYWIQNDFLLFIFFAQSIVYIKRIHICVLSGSWSLIFVGPSVLLQLNQCKALFPNLSIPLNEMKAVANRKTEWFICLDLKCDFLFSKNCIAQWNWILCLFA